jgi:bacterioferritin-associated ferredoxin
MYLCVCKAVPERRARLAIGAGACNLRDLHRQLGVGGGCGRCIPEAMKLLREAEPVPLASLPSANSSELAA